MTSLKKTLKNIWYFIWEDDSIWSWIANFILAFVLIKFIVYPSLGFMLQTTHPVVAVVSESMEHNTGFDEWWEKSHNWYVSNSISEKDFRNFPLMNGFNKGDIMALRGKKASDIKVGDVIVFWSAKRDPIIHRVVKKWKEGNAYYFQTKGDNYKTNPVSIKSILLDETRISENQIVGKAVLRIPFLGYIKIWFVEFVDAVKMVVQI